MIGFGLLSQIMVTRLGRPLAAIIRPVPKRSASTRLPTRQVERKRLGFGLCRLFLGGASSRWTPPPRFIFGLFIACTPRFRLARCGRYGSLLGIQLSAAGGCHFFDWRLAKLHFVDILPGVNAQGFPSSLTGFPGSSSNLTLRSFLL